MNAYLIVRECSHTDHPYFGYQETIKWFLFRNEAEVFTTAANKINNEWWAYYQADERAGVENIREDYIRSLSAEHREIFNTIFSGDCNFVDEISIVEMQNS